MSADCWGYCPLELIDARGDGEFFDLMSKDFIRLAGAIETLVGKGLGKSTSEKMKNADNIMIERIFFFEN